MVSLLVNNDISSGAKVFYFYIKFFAFVDSRGILTYSFSNYDSAMINLNITKRTFYNYCSELSRNGFIIYTTKGIIILEEQIHD